MNKLWAIGLFFSPLLLFSQADFEPLPIQKESYRGYLGVSVGPAIPFGAFENTDLEITEGAYAKSGLSINLDYGYRFYENLTLAGHYMRISNPLDEKALAQNSISICSNCDPPLQFSNASASSYELNAFFGGIGIIKEVESFSFQMQFMLGYGSMYTPQVELKDNSGSFLLKANNEANLAYAVGSGLRVHLTNQLDFSAFGSFVLFQAKFEQEIEYLAITEIIPSSLRYQVFTLSFGLAYRIIKKSDDSEYKLKY